jgi:ubiquinone biosynthesis protein Coq4
VYHDFAHVLAGYDTNPEGEIQQGAFQAGNRREDGFLFLLFVLVQFHLGVKITPVAEPQRGLFDVPRIMRAVERGAACKVDLTDNWNFWDVVNVPLEQLRTQYGIAPQ